MYNYAKFHSISDVNRACPKTRLKFAKPIRGVFTLCSLENLRDRKCQMLFFTLPCKGVFIHKNNKTVSSGTRLC